MNDSTSEGNKIVKEITTELVDITDTESSLLPKELSTSIELLDITVMYVLMHYPMAICPHKYLVPHYLQLICNCMSENPSIAIASYV